MELKEPSCCRSIVETKSSKGISDQSRPLNLSSHRKGPGALRVRTRPELSRLSGQLLGGVPGRPAVSRENTRRRRAADRARRAEEGRGEDPATRLLLFVQRLFSAPVNSAGEAERRPWWIR